MKNQMVHEPDSTVGLESYRKDFPILKREIRPGKRVVYLDSTATTQKPLSVIAAMNRFYQETNANIHRGVHTLAEESTTLYEDSRQKIADFIHAPHIREIVFTRNTTESINLVANTWAKAELKNGDVIILSEMEHHSNLVPWQMLAAEKNLQLEFIPVMDNGLLNIAEFERLLELHPKLLAVTHMSNVLGTINPIKEMIAKAHMAGAVVLVDGAQSVPHFAVDVQDLDADFLAFSGHKMCGPTGIGVLYGKADLLEKMPPFMGGGDMIKKVLLRSFVPNDIPYKFEAGTPAIAEVIGFGAAIDYLNKVGIDNIARHERAITTYAMEKLRQIEGMGILGPGPDQKGGVISFTLGGIHPHDVAQVLDSEGIAVRAGHHCAMPLHQRFNLPATTRASFYLYSNFEDVDLLVKGLEKVQETFS
ncbi:MAG: aminotransferase class V-fold PLP-dependent enzyme [Anaerolineaceae bacterium]